MALTWSKSVVTGRTYFFARIGNSLTLHVSEEPTQFYWRVEQASFCGCGAIFQLWGVEKTLDEAKNAVQGAAKKILTDALTEIGV